MRVRFHGPSFEPRFRADARSNPSPNGIVATYRSFYRSNRVEHGASLQQLRIDSPNETLFEPRQPNAPKRRAYRIAATTFPLLSHGIGLGIDSCQRKVEGRNPDASFTSRDIAGTRRPDWRVLGFTLGLSILTGILFGLVPALQSSRADLNSTLKESSSRSGTGLRHNKTRAVLVTTEVALALELLVGAALLIRTFIAIRQVNPGFDARSILTTRMSLTGPQFEKAAGLTQLVNEGLRRIGSLPGVEVAGFTCCVPLEGGFGLPFQIPGRPDGPTSKGGAGWTMVSAGYFETFKIPVLRGRTYKEHDDSGPPVVNY
jgi:hypothetical protein